MQMMVQTQNQRTPVSQVPGVGRKDCLYLWHSYRFVTGDPVGLYPIFNAIKGASGANGFTGPLTDRETSLVSNPGQVPLDQKWECFDLGVELIEGGTSTDGTIVQAPVSIAQAVEAYNVLQLVFIRGSTQSIPMGPISLYPGGSGLTSAVAAGDLGTAAAAFNGFQSIGARRRLGRILTLNPGDTWTMALEIANSDKLAIALGTNGKLDVRVSFWMNRDLGLSG
jgi:hypothetical protein